MQKLHLTSVFFPTNFVNFSKQKIGKNWNLKFDKNFLTKIMQKSNMTRKDFYFFYFFQFFVLASVVSIPRGM
jgi:hypothetical protein